MIRFFLIVICSFCIGQSVIGQQNAAVLDYINTYQQLAIEEMQRTGVPASIKLAQGIHETEAGRSELVLKSNNHFGIKCKSEWNGNKVYHDDDARGECFRSYDSAAASYRDHSNFLKNSQRYAVLFRLDPTDYKGWAYGLKKAGYATNIKYSQILIKLIETYNLQQYTLIALGRLPPVSEDIAGKSGLPPNPSAPSNIVLNYPEGVFQINNTRVLFAKGGTSLLTIANKHNLTLARLLDFNDITAGEGDILNEDQLIYLQRKRKTGAGTIHIVTPEETIYDIAQEEGIRYESILELNRILAGELPAVGEKIYLREKAPVKPLLVSQLPADPINMKSEIDSTINPAATLTRHIVQQKETLYAISRKYGVSTDKIKEWNKLISATLKPGQELIIYTN